MVQQKGWYRAYETFFGELKVANWMSKLVALGTDGASVNMGESGGVGAIVKRDIPHLVLFSCPFV